MNLHGQWLIQKVSSMNDFKVMANILAAVRQCEHDRQMNLSYYDLEVLKTDEITRDSIVAKLQKDGYVEGFFVIDDIDNQQYPYVVWNRSAPRITIKGLTFIEENKPLKKAMEAIRHTLLGVATNKLSSFFF